MLVDPVLFVLVRGALLFSRVPGYSQIRDLAMTSCPLLGYIPWSAGKYLTEAQVPETALAAQNTTPPCKQFRRKIVALL